VSTYNEPRLVDTLSILNGEYIPHGLVQDGWPVYSKLDISEEKGSESISLRYQFKRSRWEVIRSGLGQEELLAYASCAPPVLPEQVEPVWILYTDASWRPAGTLGFSLASQPRPFSLDVETATNDMNEAQRPDPVLFSGAQGPWAPLINGIFVPTREISTHFPIYQKADNSDVWLVFWAKSFSWRIATTEDKFTANCIAVVRCDSAVLPEQIADTWYIAPAKMPSSTYTLKTGESHASQWEEASSITIDKIESTVNLPVSSVARRSKAVVIEGASGNLAQVINGFYLPTLESYGGFTVYEKLNNSDKWLIYNPNSQCWNITRTVDKHRSFRYAFMPNYPATEPDQGCESWHVLQGSTFEVDDNIVIAQAPQSLIDSSTPELVRGPGSPGLLGGFTSHGTLVTPYSSVTNSIAGSAHRRNNNSGNNSGRSSGKDAGDIGNRSPMSSSSKTKSLMRLQSQLTEEALYVHTAAIESEDRGTLQYFQRIIQHLFEFDAVVCADESGGLDFEETDEIRQVDDTLSIGSKEEFKPMKLNLPSRQPSGSGKDTGNTTNANVSIVAAGARNNNASMIFDQSLLTRAGNNSVLAAVDELFSVIDDAPTKRNGAMELNKTVVKEKDSATRTDVGSTIIRNKNVVLDCDQPSTVTSVCINPAATRQSPRPHCACTVNHVSVTDRHASSEFMKVVITCTLQTADQSSDANDANGVGMGGPNRLQHMINMSSTSRLAVGHESLILLSHHCYSAAGEALDSDIDSVISRSTLAMPAVGHQVAGSAHNSKGSDHTNDSIGVVCKLTYRLPTRSYEQLFFSQPRFRFGDYSFTDALLVLTRNETKEDQDLKNQALKTIARMQAVGVVKISDNVVRVLVSDYLKNQASAINISKISDHNIMASYGLTQTGVFSEPSALANSANSGPTSVISTILCELQKLELSSDLDELITSVNDKLTRRFGDWISDWCHYCIPTAAAGVSGGKQSALHDPFNNMLKAAEYAAFELNSLKHLCRNLLPTTLAHATRDIRMVNDSRNKDKERADANMNKKRSVSGSFDDQPTSLETLYDANNDATAAAGVSCPAALFGKYCRVKAILLATDAQEALLYGNFARVNEAGSNFIALINKYYEIISDVPFAELFVLDESVLRQSSRKVLCEELSLLISEVESFMQSQASQARYDDVDQLALVLKELSSAKASAGRPFRRPAGNILFDLPNHGSTNNVSGGSATNNMQTMIVVNNEHALAWGSFSPASSIGSTNTVCLLQSRRSALSSASRQSSKHDHVAVGSASDGSSSSITWSVRVDQQIPFCAVMSDCDVHLSDQGSDKGNWDSATMCVFVYLAQEAADEDESTSSGDSSEDIQGLQQRPNSLAVMDDKGEIRKTVSLVSSANSKPSGHQGYYEIDFASILAEDCTKMSRIQYFIRLMYQSPAVPDSRKDSPSQQPEKPHIFDGARLRVCFTHNFTYDSHNNTTYYFSATMGNATDASVSPMTPITPRRVMLESEPAADGALCSCEDCMQAGDVVCVQCRATFCRTHFESPSANHRCLSAGDMSARGPGPTSVRSNMRRLQSVRSSQVKYADCRDSSFGWDDVYMHDNPEAFDGDPTHFDGGTAPGIPSNSENDPAHDDVGATFSGDMTNMQQTLRRHSQALRNSIPSAPIEAMPFGSPLLTTDDLFGGAYESDEKYGYEGMGDDNKLEENNVKENPLLGSTAFHQLYQSQQHNNKRSRSFASRSGEGSDAPISGVPAFISPLMKLDTIYDSTFSPQEHDNNFVATHDASTLRRSLHISTNAPATAQEFSPQQAEEDLPELTLETQSEASHSVTGMLFGAAVHERVEKRITSKVSRTSSLADVLPESTANDGDASHSVTNMLFGAGAHHTEKNPLNNHRSRSSSRTDDGPSPAPAGDEGHSRTEFNSALRAAVVHPHALHAGAASGVANSRSRNAPPRPETDNHHNK
jgi:hypothetical protein